MGTTLKKVPLIVIVGETASGKTATAIALATQIHGEVICADSQTVYKRLSICTAKPTASEQLKVPHHLIDQVSPDENFNVAQFQVLANKKIKEIGDRKHFPILVGGSGLYISSVIYNFSFGLTSETLRRKLESMTSTEIVAYATTNNVPLEGIEPTNKRHLVRVVERGGVTEKKRVLRDQTIVLGLHLDKQNLQQRIHIRVEQMFDDGLVKEVETVAKKFGWDCPALTAKCYQDVQLYLNKNVTLDQLKQSFISRDTNLAKKQRTWWKQIPDIQWCSTPEEVFNVALKFITDYRVY